MRVGDLERLYDYHYWANQRLLDVVSQLAPEDFTRSVAGSYGSIRSTLVHVLSAEWGWLERCGGPARGERLRPEQYPTVDELVRAWTQVQASVRRFLSDLSDGDLRRPVTFALGDDPPQSLPLGDLLMHAAIHAAHHRGQVALLLRAIGWVPSAFDFLLFAGEPRSAPAPA